MPREKYRVHEVAKDFGLNSKKILAILETHMPAERTHMAALEDRELDLIFETITQENAVESFDAYFTDIAFRITDNIHHFINRENF